MPKSKIDLTYLKRLVAELETSLTTAEGIKTDVASDKVEWMVEMNKATGVAAGIMTEAAMLMGDMQHSLQGVQGGASSGKQDLLEKLLGGLKGPGNAN